MMRTSCPFQTHSIPITTQQFERLNPTTSTYKANHKEKFNFIVIYPYLKKFLSYTTIALSKCQNRFFVNRLNFI